MGTMIRELFRRRVPQVLGVYLAAAWGLLEFTDWAVLHFSLERDPTPLVFGTLAVLLLPVLAAAWWLGGRDASPPKQEPGPRSVAVLPFAVVGDDPETEALGFGLADQILTDLSRVGDLQVAARTSSFAYGGTDMDVRTMGRRLGVRAVLEGSVQRMGDRLRVTMQLVNVEDGYHLWSQRYDRTMEDVFRIQDEVAQSVARVLHAILRASERRALRRPPTRDIGAYEAYLRGRGYLVEQHRRNLEYARQMFRRALELDPDFALAYTGLAEAIAVLCMYYPSVARTELDEADEASRRALELEPELAEAHAMRGAVRFLQGRLDEAERSFRRAEELDPRLADAWYLHGRMAFQEGRFLEAAELLRRAESEGGGVQAAFFTAQSLQAAGSDDAPEAFAHAAQVARSHLELNPDHPRAATMAAVAFCRVGDEEEGLRWAERALVIDPDDAGVRYNVACLYAVAGRTERALECMEEARARGFGNREWLEKDPDLDSLRGHPRFQELLAGM
jgi:TolB-like protein/Flp pilus assembly protein TadD